MRLLCDKVRRCLISCGEPLPTPAVAMPSISQHESMYVDRKNYFTSQTIDITTENTMPQHMQSITDPSLRVRRNDLAGQTRIATGQGLPRVHIITTGGTIAGRGKSMTDFGTYTTADMQHEEQLSGIRSSLEQIAAISEQPFRNIGSPDMTLKVQIELQQMVQHALNREDIDGVVITHGTDTLEETSFFLDITVCSPKPVVITGAMLPSSSHSADGPKNVIEAVRVAGDHDARDRGVLVVFNGKIMHGQTVIKADANMTDTFQDLHGTLGQVIDLQPEWFRLPARPNGLGVFDISHIDTNKRLPEVALIVGHSNISPRMLKAMFGYPDHGWDGVVLGGMGAGCWSFPFRDQLDQVIGKMGVPVIASYRSAHGCVRLNEIYGLPEWTIRSGFLNMYKSCKLLEVCLALDMDKTDIKKRFGDNRRLA